MRIAICKSTKEMCEMLYDKKKCRIDCGGNAEEPLCYFCYDDTRDHVYCHTPGTFPSSIDKYCETENQLVLLIAKSKNEDFRTRAKYVLKNNIPLTKEEVK